MPNMIRTNQNNNPVIDVHIQDPFELAQHYHDILNNDEFNHYISCILQHQYHINYSSPFLSHEDKIQRLSFLSSCLHDLENLKQETALVAAGVIMDPFLSLGVEANEQAKRPSTMNRVVQGITNAVTSGWNNMQQIADKTKLLNDIKALQQKIKADLENFTKTYQSKFGADKMDILNIEWNNIYRNIQLLHQLKTRAGIKF